MAAVLSILHRLLRLLRRTRSSPDRTPSNALVIPNDVIREILKLLPVKSLMRFKCVSKNWLSIINDPSFTSTFGGGFRGPIVLWPWRAKKRYLMIDYVRIDDTGPIATCEAYHHSTVDQHEGDQILAYTGVVNGLVCFLDGRGNQSWLYNIATRERVRLPVSVSVPPTDKVICNCQMGLGFDPVSKLYKLLKRSAKKDKEDEDGELHPATVYFEILTIGVDSSWRTIDSPPLKSTFGYLGTCTDGVIYGMEFMYTEDCFLTSFHVAEERFLSVKLPHDFFNQPPCFFRWRIRQRGFCPLKLLSFFPGPGPALVSYGPHGASHVDRYRYGEGEGGRESGGTWETAVLTLHGGIFSPRGILPNGKVLLVDYRGPGPGPGRIALYDPISRLLEKVLIVNWHGRGTVKSCTTLDPAPGAPGDFCYLEENIVSLKCLTSCSN